MVLSGTSSDVIHLKCGCSHGKRTSRCVIKSMRTLGFQSSLHFQQVSSRVDSNLHFDLKASVIKISARVINIFITERTLLMDQNLDEKKTTSNSFS